MAGARTFARRFLAHTGAALSVLFLGTVVALALFAGLLAVANRRASRQQAEQRDTDPPDVE